MIEDALLTFDCYWKRERAKESANCRLELNFVAGREGKRETRGSKDRESNPLIQG